MSQGATHEEQADARFEQHASEVVRHHRKWNGSPAAVKLWRRQEITQLECARRGVRFLPLKCLRPLFESQGVL